MAELKDINGNNLKEGFYKQGNILYYVKSSGIGFNARSYQGGVSNVCNDISPRLLAAEIRASHFEPVNPHDYLKTKLQFEKDAINRFIKENQPNLKNEHKYKSTPLENMIVDIATAKGSLDYDYESKRNLGIILWELSLDCKIHNFKISYKQISNAYLRFFKKTINGCKEISRILNNKE